MPFYPSLIIIQYTRCLESHSFPCSLFPPYTDYTSRLYNQQQPSTMFHLSTSTLVAVLAALGSTNAAPTGEAQQLSKRATSVVSQCQNSGRKYSTASGLASMKLLRQYSMCETAR